MALLTLTSDFGQKDYLVGAVKGQLAQINPAFNIMDISHDLSPFNYPQAAYVCRNAIRQFPPFTYHLILVEGRQSPGTESFDAVKSGIREFLMTQKAAEVVGAVSRLTNELRGSSRISVFPENIK